MRGMKKRWRHCARPIEYENPAAMLVRAVGVAGAILFVARSYVADLVKQSLKKP